MTSDQFIPEVFVALAASIGAVVLTLVVYELWCWWKQRP